MAVTAIPATVAVTTPAATAGVDLGIAYVETDPDGYWMTRPSEPMLATLFVPASVTAWPPDVTAWPLIITVESPGAADITWPAMVAIAVDFGASACFTTVGLE